ncbi:MAG TPA: hypothetical protein VNS22_22510 [Geminicoccus sp.]|uniref:hypothetical protein n=1 Tax=Geminicoccus sp. TaxID=2024832 RepID=UPI002CE40D7A|nr:hypothetical protein [Geminicoccus sp.]HWL71132.1 hypothetical protein [Geminicoccus sp.]
MSTIRSTFAAALLLGLTGCSGGDDAPRPTASSEPYCPRPTLVADLAVSEGRSADGQAAWTATLGDLRSSCEAREFDYLVDFDVTVDLRTGPGYAGDRVQVDYFVAVTTDTGEVVDKQTFPVILQPGRNERRTMRRETLRQRLPFTHQDQPAIWSVLVGFEPTEQQVRDRIEPLPALGEGASTSGGPGDAGGSPGSGQ